jgi:hypothetical protein
MAGGEAERRRLEMHDAGELQDAIKQIEQSQRTSDSPGSR